MSQGVTFILSRKNKECDFIVDESMILSICPSLKDFNENVDKENKDEVYEELFRKRGDIKSEIKKLAEAIEKELGDKYPEKFSNRRALDGTKFIIYFENHNKNSGYIYPWMLIYMEAFLNEKPISKSPVLDFEEDSSSDEELDPFRDFARNSEYSEELEEEHEEREQSEDQDEQENQNHYENFVFPTEIPMPMISVTEFERLIKYVPLRKDIEFVKATEKTDSVFKENPKLVIREGFEQVAYNRVYQSDKKIHKITVTYFERKD